jgi:hypothetical protein
VRRPSKKDEASNEVGRMIMSQTDRKKDAEIAVRRVCVVLFLAVGILWYASQHAIPSVQEPTQQVSAGDDTVRTRDVTIVSVPPSSSGSSRVHPIALKNPRFDPPSINQIVGSPQSHRWDDLTEKDVRISTFSELLGQKEKRDNIGGDEDKWWDEKKPKQQLAQVDRFQQQEFERQQRQRALQDQIRQQQAARQEEIWRQQEAARQEQIRQQQEQQDIQRRLEQERLRQQAIKKQQQKRYGQEKRILDQERARQKLKREKEAEQKQREKPIDIEKPSEPVQPE